MKRIAIVEDNDDNMMLLTALLEDDYELDEYVDGIEALAGLAASPPDLVLLDISLPGMGGEEILARLRLEPWGRSLRVIALTAHAMSGDKERFLSQGFDGYFAKPIVDEEALYALIESNLPQ